MKLLLCSDFTGVGYRYLRHFKEDFSGKTCLFVGYASEDDDEMYNSSARDVLQSFGFNVVDLVPDFDFNQKIDAVFVRGGNTTKLIDYLRRFGQYDKVKGLAASGTLYIGNSAGSVLVGTNTAWTLDSEPYADITGTYGSNALKGFGFIGKLVFVHCTKYRMCRDYEMKDESDIFRTLDTDCYPAYLRDIKKYRKDEFLRIGNNQVYFENGDNKKIITYNWRKVPIKIINKS